MLTAWSSPRRGAGRSTEELRWWRHRNATILSMLAYAGLRPVEDRGSRRDDLQGRTMHVVATKTGRARDVDLLAPLAQDLAEWRLISGRPSGKGLIFPTMDGDEWKRHDWQNWRRRVYQPAAIEAGVTGDLRPYRLRGSFVSLLLWEGRSLAYVAEQAGHSIATLAKHYAGVIRELENEPRKPAAKRFARPASRCGVRQMCERPNWHPRDLTRTACKSGNGRCWARTSDLRLVETARPDSQMPSWVKESQSMQGVRAVRFGIRWPCRTVINHPVGRNGDAAGPRSNRTISTDAPGGEPAKSSAAASQSSAVRSRGRGCVCARQAAELEQAVRPRLTPSSGRERRLRRIYRLRSDAWRPPRSRSTWRSRPSRRPLAGHPTVTAV